MLHVTWLQLLSLHLLKAGSNFFLVGGKTNQYLYDVRTKGTSSIK